MLAYIYPEEEQTFFTNRTHELASLELSKSLIIQGVRRNLAFSGFRRIGKTLILKEFLKRHLVDQSTDSVDVAYIDLPRLAATPEMFAVQYIGALVFWLTARDEGRIEAYYDPAFQISAVSRLNNVQLTDYLLAFHQELRKSAPSQHLLLEMAFNWPEIWAGAQNRRIMIILDEFPQLLALNSFPQIRDAIAQFRAVLQAQSRACYIVAGSMVSLMHRMVLQAESPLFLHFQLETIGPFGRADSDDLARRRLALTGTDVPPGVLAAVYELTRGHPFYVYAVVMRVVELVALLNHPVSVQTVQEAFALETLDANGRIYSLCHYLLEESLQRVRGESIPLALLQSLAREDRGLTLTELARRIRRPSGAVRQIINWLSEVDLVAQQDDKSYVFCDPVLQLWVAFYYAGVQLSGMPDQRVLGQLVSEVLEKYQRIAGELGTAKESQIRELIRRFAGQIVDGHLFGQSAAMRLPSFDRVAPYRSDDGQVQIDAVADGTERWAVEIKWRNKLAGLREVRNLAEKAKAVGAQPWLISRRGLTSEARTYVEQNHIHYSAEEQLRSLERILDQPGFLAEETP